VQISGLTAIAPNPASGRTRIDYVLAHADKVWIGVVDVTGRQVEVLADGPMAAGSHSLLWDGRRGNARLAAGVYFVRWQTPERTMRRKLVVTE